MMQKKISIIVPAYNGSDKIRGCLDSIIHQTMPIEEFEIIIVDDCSTDGGKTWEVICEYEARYPDSIIALHTEENALPGGARNAGLPYASGQLITFSDQDDFLLPDAFSTAYELYEEHEYDLLCFGIEDLKKYGNLDDDYVVIEDQIPAKKLFIINAVYTVWGNYYKNSLVTKYALKFTEKSYHEEHPFAIPAIILAEKLILSDKPAYLHTDNKQSASYNRSTGMFSPDHAADMTKSILYLIDCSLKNPKEFERFQREIECNALCLLLLNNFIANVSAGNIPGYEMVLYNQRIVNTYFPGWRDNPYFKIAVNPTLKVDMLLCFETIMTPVSKENYEDYVAVLKLLR